MLLENCCNLLHCYHTLFERISHCEVCKTNRMRAQKFVSFAYFSSLVSDLTQLGGNDWENRLAVRISFLKRTSNRIYVGIGIFHLFYTQIQMLLLLSHSSTILFPLFLFSRCCQLADLLFFLLHMTMGN